MGGGLLDTPLDLPVRLKLTSLHSVCCQTGKLSYDLQLSSLVSRLHELNNPNRRYFLAFYMRMDQVEGEERETRATREGEARVLRSSHASLARKKQQYVILTSVPSQVLFSTFVIQRTLWPGHFCSCV